MRADPTSSELVHAPASAADGEDDRWFLGTRMRVVSDAATTGGQLTVREQWAQRGFSPPLHVHHAEDTALQVLDGELTVVVGGRTVQLGAGGFTWLARDVPHSFRVDSESAHLLEFATPGGVEGFHLAASTPADGPGFPAPSEPDVGALVEAFARYSGEIVGPPLGPADLTP